MFISIEALELQLPQYDLPTRNDPRADMAVRLPGSVQPFLTWLTAKPAPGEASTTRSPIWYVVAAIALTLGGCAVSSVVMLFASKFGLSAYVLLPAGLIATTSGLGLFQVGIFHHCAHNGVFRAAKHNRATGRLISALLLFKYFDSYKHDHMMHHNPKILFTMEDEFSDFIVNICSFSSGMSRAVLWRRLILALVSPMFHASFMARRIRGSLGSANRRHNLVGITVWTSVFAFCLLTHSLLEFAVAWLLPITVLLQIATVFRILCEHRVPEVEVIRAGGPTLVSQATAAVFAGAKLPATELPVMRAMLAWSLWWANMLTVQLFVRIFILVGDAPCHDFHHRRPARRWTNYIHARQADLDEGCPGFPRNYVETWGLFRAVDENFVALAKAPADLMR
jgi:fatty acid desaturase